jgi:hypothetical protein
MLPLSEQMNATFYISNGGDALGPFEISQLRAMWSTGQIAADFLYWNEQRQEWHSIVELDLGNVAEPAKRAAPARETLAHKVGGTTKRETPIRYWMWRLGSIGLGLGFLVGLKQAASLDPISAVAYSLGAAAPVFLLFAFIGMAVGYVAAWRQRSGGGRGKH